MDMDMDNTGKPLVTDAELVVCAGCTQVSGSSVPVRHLPPACRYEPGSLPVPPPLPDMLRQAVRGLVPAEVLDGLAFPAARTMVVGNRPVPPDRVADLMRERLAEPDQVTVPRAEWDRLLAIAGTIVPDQTEIVVRMEDFQELETLRELLGRLQRHLEDAGEIVQGPVPAGPYGKSDGTREHPLEGMRRIYDRLLAVDAQRAAGWDAVKAGAELGDKLALCFRAHYQREIESGAHNRFPGAAECAVHYLLIERDLTRRGLWGRLKYALWGV